ncbi:MAG TPA: amidohydrolase family protein [Verrucomicrobiae bacterium]|nr:amidohydrolase family protein [Verrucomicrobiae bacterium]
MKIDSHHHFWKYNPTEYGWIDDSMRVIRRDFFPEDLRTEITAARVDGVISVEAQQSTVETQRLLDFAAQHDFIKGVAGWVELISTKAGAQLEQFATNRKLKSVRHVVQGEPDENFILRDDFNRGIRELTRFGLAYDILIFERHLPQTIRFVDAHPGQIFILDHLAKPRIKDNLLEPWRANICELARRENIFCKLSGMVTEADYNTWTEAQLRPYFETALEAFGPKRLMFGSDWPVCLVACSYARWHALVSNWIGQLSAGEQDSILGGTAVEAYKL